MAGYGTGYPAFFICARLARRWPRTQRDYDRHEISLTGKTKRNRQSPGKGHPRKSYASVQYRCSCGHEGWTSHIDPSRQAVGLGFLTPVQVWSRWRWVPEMDKAKWLASGNEAPE